MTVQVVFFFYITSLGAIRVAQLLLSYVVRAVLFERSGKPLVTLLRLEPEKWAHMASLISRTVANCLVWLVLKIA